MNGNAISATRQEMTSQVQLGRLASETSGTHHEAHSDDFGDPNHCFPLSTTLSSLYLYSILNNTICEIILSLCITVVFSVMVSSDCITQLKALSYENYNLE